MFFETEITSYYKDTFQIIHLNQYIYAILIIWTLLKFFFYVVPLLVLFKQNDEEKFVNINIKISNFRKLSRNIVIFSMLLPLVDCFVFFYIVVALVGRVEGLYPRTIRQCQIYGINAGILNVIIISNFQNLMMFSSGIIFTDQTYFFIAFNTSVFSAWVFLSVNHLFYLYSLNEEVIRKQQHSAMFSDYEDKRPFTADHL